MDCTDFDTFSKFLVDKQSRVNECLDVLRAGMDELLVFVRIRGVTLGEGKA